MLRIRLFFILTVAAGGTAWAAHASFSLGAALGGVLALLGTWLLPRFLDTPLDATAQTLLRLTSEKPGSEKNLSVPLWPSEAGASLDLALREVSLRLHRDVEILKTERDLLTRVLNRMEEGVLVLDSEGRITEANRALLRLLMPRPSLAVNEADGGATQQTEPPSLLNVRGKAVLEVFRNAELAALIANAREEGRATSEVEISGIRPRRLLTRANWFVEAPSGTVIVFIDVTNLRRLETLRRDFVANVSHELLTPVAAVRTAAETMRGVADDKAAGGLRFLDIIDRNTERLTLLVRDLLELSRIESREFRLNWENIDMRPFLEGVLALFRQRSEARNIPVNLQVPADATIVRGDRRALEMTISNLVDNALKYCPSASTVTVSVKQDEHQSVLRVADTGPGIEAEHLPRLFERFYRVDPGRSRDRGGTGLGLSIVKHLCEAMDGQVGVDSTVGQGTTFVIIIPRRGTGDTSHPGPEDKIRSTISAWDAD